jgi:hypothetical protein
LKTMFYFWGGATSGHFLGAAMHPPLCKLISYSRVIQQAIILVPLMVIEWVISSGLDVLLPINSFLMHFFSGRMSISEEEGSYTYICLGVICHYRPCRKCKGLKCFDICWTGTGISADTI